MSNIIVIEDDTLLGNFLVSSLKNAGLDATLEVTGTEALTHIGLDNPDLILLDIMLPDISGFEILRRLKRSASTQNIPVIVVSNLGGREDIERALELGASHYFIKANVLPEDIIDKIKETLNSKTGE